MTKKNRTIFRLDPLLVSICAQVQGEMKAKKKKMMDVNNWPYTPTMDLVRKKLVVAKKEDPAVSTNYKWIYRIYIRLQKLRADLVEGHPCRLPEFGPSSGRPSPLSDDEKDYLGKLFQLQGMVIDDLPYTDNFEVFIYGKFSKFMRFEHPMCDVWRWLRNECRENHLKPKTRGSKDRSKYTDWGDKGFPGF